MPKIKPLTEEMRKLNTIYADIYGRCKANKITQTTLAQNVGMSQQSLSRKLLNRSLSLRDFVLIEAYLDEIEQK